jgi:S1-C subfamily serine protease
MVQIAEPSVQSLFLVAMSAGVDLGTGTGFIVKHNGQPYLITNYHVAAGRNPDNGQPLHPSGSVPDTLRVVQLLGAGPGQIRWEPRDERVLEHGTENALWLQHPVQGRSVDVVALPLRNTAGIDIHPYDLTDTAPKLRFGPSDGVNIIGFPFGRTGGGAFAIWTRGFVASEPEIDLDDLPRFLIDARTRPGQSGSPVIAYGGGGITAMADGSTAMFNGTITNLLGVYSGRINRESDLGYVWKVQAVRDILTSQQVGKAGL